MGIKLDKGEHERSFMRVRLSFEADKTPVMRVGVGIDGHKTPFVRKDPSVDANNFAVALRPRGSTPGQRMLDDEHDDGTEDRDQDAPEVEPRDPA